MNTNAHHRRVCTLALLLTITGLSAQKEALHWYFGRTTHLDFSQAIPRISSEGAIEAYESSAAYSNSEGELLFYTNGGGSLALEQSMRNEGYIWNRRHEVMYDMGFTQGGGFSAAQGALILPVPGARERYYLFTIDEHPRLKETSHRGLSYFIIDMTRNGGLGEVVLADQRIHRPAVECLTALRRPDGRGYWLLTVDKATEDFLLVPVDERGIQPPIRQPRADTAGCFVIKASPDGRYLCANGRLYTFEPNSGAIRHWLQLPQASSYTFSFSPDSRYLYTLNARDGQQMIRYDLQAADVAASREVVATSSPFFAGQMQIGPDGQLYYLELTLNSLAAGRNGITRVECPDAARPTVQRDFLRTPHLPDIGVVFAFPNYPDFLFAEPMRRGDTLEICAGQAEPLQARCVGANYRWSTGESIPTITPTEAGVYTVSVSNSCGRVLGIETFTVRVDTPPTLSISVDPGDCEEQPIHLVADIENAESFRWSTGETDSLLLDPAPGTYQLMAANRCGETEITYDYSGGYCCRLFLPNVFSPNDDGRNDIFQPQAFDCALTNYHLRIFSRWGQLVFESTDPTRGWNGLLQDAPAATGVYLWSIDYQTQHGAFAKTRQKTGDLLLVR